MSLSVIVHIANEEPVIAELEAAPKPSDQFLMLLNPRKQDGRDLHYLADDVTTMIVPWHRIIFVEIVPSTEAEDIISFVRD